MSDLVGQQELMEPDPRTVIEASSGGRFWWGVDPGSVMAAIAWTDGESRGVRRLPFDTTMSGSRRLAHIHALVSRTVYELAHEAPPLAVWVEDVALYKSERGNVMAACANGVIQAAVFEALEHFNDGEAVYVEAVPVGHWKLRGLGNGATKKPEILRWASELMPPDRAICQDEADALGIAEGCRRTVAVEALAA